ncbi:hypothetical protein TRICI_001422 [Trichomonascus ciferrii]|uniref:SUZ domain-containing protein n=1 Tax=Trichomonascus ciferrii TaxID=44093 RepID=A0A642VA28_9ASCO|nr:hypothetical protein TRICI_001422 [Trichomonascus ciferrii]
MSGSWGTTSTWDSWDRPTDQATKFKPQVKLLKREGGSSADGKQGQKDTPVPQKDDYQTRELKYLRAREKIFGGVGDRSPTNSPEPWDTKK